jgi:hypothetical protein
MRYTDLMESKTVYYHGSYNELPVGTVLHPSDEYDDKWSDASFKVLEQHRPVGTLAHRQAVFMAATPQDVDNLGGATDWLFTVKPNGPVVRYDQSWVSVISELLDDNPPDSPAVIQAATNYWASVKNGSECVWEYLTTSATIVAVEEY